MESFLECVTAILHKHHVKYVHLIGHSAGGYYAQLYAQNYPSTVKSLSLISSMVPLNCPETRSILNGQWTFIKFMTLHMRAFSKFYFKKMAESIRKNYDKQLHSNMETVSENERQYIESHYDQIKNVIMKAVANNGLGVYYDAYALCQKRETIQIPNEIPVYIWNGTADTTTPLPFAKYLEHKYDAKAMHLIEDGGHMMYLTIWEDIIKQATLHN